MPGNGDSAGSEGKAVFERTAEDIEATLKPTNPHYEGFGKVVKRMVETHIEHGGWVITDDGLRCQHDHELCVPSVEWMTENGPFNP